MDFMEALDSDFHINIHKIWTNQVYLKKKPFHKTIINMAYDQL